MTRLNLEKLAAERRMKKRGTERVSGSGFTVELAQRANAGVRSAERFIEAAKSYRPIEEAVETARHVPDAKLGGLTPADRDAWTRGILDACED